MKQNYYYNNNEQRTYNIKNSYKNKNNLNFTINSNDRYNIDFSLKQLKNEIKDMSKTLVKLNKQTDNFINNKKIDINNRPNYNKSNFNKSEDYFIYRNKKNLYSNKNNKNNSIDGNLNRNSITSKRLSSGKEYSLVSQSINEDINLLKYFNNDNKSELNLNFDYEEYNNNKSQLNQNSNYEKNNNKLNHYKKQIQQKNEYIQILEKQLNEGNNNKEDNIKNKMNVNNNNIKNILQKNRELIEENKNKNKL